MKGLAKLLLPQSHQAKNEGFSQLNVLKLELTTVDCDILCYWLLNKYESPFTPIHDILVL